MRPTLKTIKLYFPLGKKNVGSTYPASNFSRVHKRRAMFIMENPKHQQRISASVEI